VTRLTGDKLAPNSEHGPGHVIPKLKTAAIEAAQDRATIRLVIYTL